jgi:hypothetical protein
MSKRAIINRENDEAFLISLRGDTASNDHILARLRIATHFGSTRWMQQFSAYHYACAQLGYTPEWMISRREKLTRAMLSDIGARFGSAVKQEISDCL